MFMQYSMVNTHSQYTKPDNFLQPCIRVADDRTWLTAAKEMLRIVFMCDHLLLALGSYYFIAVLHTQKRPLEKKVTYIEHRFSQHVYSVNIYANMQQSWTFFS